LIGGYYRGPGATGGGVYLGVSVTASNDGTITGFPEAVRFGGAYDTLVNSGSLVGSVDTTAAAANDYVDNTASGSITGIAGAYGQYYVGALGGSGATLGVASSLTNSGAITGGAGGAAVRVGIGPQIGGMGGAGPRWRAGMSPIAA
jgi:fibronectin-binding autotransporter adhesin